MSEPRTPCWVCDPEEAKKGVSVAWCSRCHVAPAPPEARMTPAEPVELEKIAAEVATRIGDSAYALGYSGVRAAREILTALQSVARDAAEKARGEERERWARIAEVGGYGFDVTAALRKFATRLRGNA